MPFDIGTIRNELKTAAKRIRTDAQTIVELTRFKTAALLVCDMVADGLLDPHDCLEKISTLIVAENFELEKRAIELSRNQASTSFGELEDSLEKTAEEEDESEGEAAHRRLMQDLRQINGQHSW